MGSEAHWKRILLERMRRSWWLLEVEGWLAGRDTMVVVEATRRAVETVAAAAELFRSFELHW